MDGATHCGLHLASDALKCAEGIWRDAMEAARKIYERWAGSGDGCS